MRRLVLSFLILSFAGSLFGVEIIPPAPDSHTYIRVRFLSKICAPVADVAVSGSKIVLTTRTRPGFSCIALVPPQVATADLGLLPPGVYDIEAEGLEHATLIVRDAGAGILVSPVGVPTDGGRTVQVFGDPGVFLPATVLFDGVPASAVSADGQQVVVTPPPHAAGTVDVTVIDPLGTRKAIAAFTYFDPAAPPDPFVFEPLIFPVAYDGAGEFGSQWTTDNLVATRRTLVGFRQSVKTKRCSGVCKGFDWSALLAPQSQSGFLLWVVRRRLPLERTDEFRTASRVIDTSRLHEGGGTSLPVARERDLRDVFTIDDIPIGGSARVTLRVYSPGETPSRGVQIIVASATGTSGQLLLLRPVNGIAFASLDLTPPAPSARATPATVTVISQSLTGPKIWGLVTVTDNVTQEVTALWPR